MLYFFDFDRTLFNTDAYLRHLPEHPACAGFADELRAVIAAGRDETLTGGKERIAAWEKVSKAIEDGTLTFTAGELAPYLYPDVSEVLRHLGNEAIIITYGEEKRQRAKVESALANTVRATVLYTGEKSKAEFLKTYAGYNGQEAIFVEDRSAELETLHEAFPNLRLFLIERGVPKTSRHLEVPPPVETETRWKRITSLNDLP